MHSHNNSTIIQNIKQICKKKQGRNDIIQITQNIHVVAIWEVLWEKPDHCNLFERRKRSGQKAAGNKRKTCQKTVIRGDIYVCG